jgi:hypothetical protein
MATPSEHRLLMVNSGLLLVLPLIHFQTLLVLRAAFTIPRNSSWTFNKEISTPVLPNCTTTSIKRKMSGCTSCRGPLVHLSDDMVISTPLSITPGAVQ